MDLAPKKLHKEIIQFLEEKEFQAEINTLRATIEKIKVQYKEREAKLIANHQDAIQKREIAFNDEKEAGEKASKSKEKELELKINTLEATIENLKIQYKECENALIKNFKRREQELQETIKKLTQREGALNTKENETSYY